MGTATADEMASYNKWYASFEDSELELTYGDERANAQLGAKLYAKLMVRIEEDQPKKLSFASYRKWAAAAAAILLITVGGYWAYEGNILDKLTGGYLAQHQPIVPGKSTATLRLANGQLIPLKESEDGLVIEAEHLAYTDGTDIAFPEDQVVKTQEMVLSTPRGGTYQVMLPDGSKVWLNAESSITLPADFASASDRRVRLIGEAYFEISKAEKRVAGVNKRRRFTVEVGNQSVEVLGTHFNINSYNASVGFKTTLLEGSVKVIAGKQQKIIQPGQQAFATGQNIIAKPVDIEEVMAWKNNNFQFANAKIADIMEEIARWYNVEIVYRGEVTQEGFGGAISRNKPIIEVLASLEETGAVHFKIEGRRVIVMP